jgi:Mg-chelatase subunit ChlD
VRRGRRGSFAPLARKPKDLEREPTLFRTAEDVRAGQQHLSGAAGGRPGSPRGEAAADPHTAAGESDHEGTHSTALARDSRLDPETARRLRVIASRMSLPKPRPRSTDQGSGELASVPYRDGNGDLDLDRSLEALARRHPDPYELVVRERVRARRSIALLVDVSGSMKGERAQTAAATIGALASELHRDRLAVIAFWSDAALLQSFDHPLTPVRLVDELVRIPARGLTNLTFPITLADRQLRGVPPSDARVLMLSDCVHNAGPDPRVAAGRVARVDVLADCSGEHDLGLARDLARAGGGAVKAVRDYRDVARALEDLFSR